jgi:hypothetical protein
MPNKATFPTIVRPSVVVAFQALGRREYFAAFPAGMVLNLF